MKKYGIIMSHSTDNAIKTGINYGYDSTPQHVHPEGNRRKEKEGREKKRERERERDSTSTAVQRVAYRKNGGRVRELVHGRST